MARYARTDHRDNGVREYLIRRYTAMAEHYRALNGQPWSNFVTQLESGAPVTVRGWQLWRVAPTVDRQAFYRVEGDGSVRELSEEEWRGTC